MLFTLSDVTRPVRVQHLPTAHRRIPARPPVARPLRIVVRPHVAHKPDAVLKCLARAATVLRGHPLPHGGTTKPVRAYVVLFESQIPGEGGEGWEGDEGGEDEGRGK